MLTSRSSTWLALASFGCLTLIMVLAGCRTLKSGSENQESTALKAVSDSQYILRLAPYKGADYSQFVFEVCQISSPNDGCAIAFLSSSRQPVVFTAQQIRQHHETAAEALAKLVKDNPELAGAGASATAAPVTYKVGTKMLNPETSLQMKVEVMAMIESQGWKSFEEAQTGINTQKNILAERFGLEIDRFEIRHDGTARFVKSKKLSAHLNAQETFPTHVFKQDFVDFIKNQYRSQLAAHSVTAEEVLRWPTLYTVDKYSDHYKPQLDWDKLVKEYRAKIYAGGLPPKTSYQSVIDDLIDPTMADEFKKFSNLIQVAEDLEAGTLSSFQDALEKPLTRFDVHNQGVKAWNLKETKSTGHSAAIHIRDFAENNIPYDLSKNQVLNNIIRLNFAIQDHLPNKAAFLSTKKQLNKLGMTSEQAIKKWGNNKRLVKRVSVFFVVLAGILAGTSGVKKVFGVGSGVDKEESIALTHPSLFETDADTSPVDTVQGIVVQLGEYLNKMGVDIDYYCMTSGCHLLY